VEHPEAISVMHVMKPAVYILFNKPRGVLYTGVTNDLLKRMVEHKQRLHGFTAKYNVTKLGHCEYFQDIRDAILREKQIKAGNRKKKIELIESQNPEWKDLFENEF
jgi:putative endonuclease